jgi:hypothetical protein
VADGDMRALESRSFDVALSAFTFDNIPTLDKKTRLFLELGRVIKPDGVIVNLVSSPEIYTHEWVSFSTRDFPENHRARSGDVVRIIITDIDDARPVEDVVCSPEDYARVYANAGLTALDVVKPLARGDEAYDWVNETRIAPWTVYVLGHKR